ncbi:unnamed protein product [Orchesella dallaii]|uniref:Uncharacterized protein n=1 Tax=Orchesella dallaii TaxID=48710 RepID=A0ABP1PYC9_9HEXA
MRAKRVSVFSYSACLTSFLALIAASVLASQNSLSKNVTQIYNLSSGDEWKDKIPVIYDTSAIDGEFQNELAKSVVVALRVLEDHGLQPLFLDLAKLDATTSKVNAIQKCSKILIMNKFTVLVSLLNGDELKKFSHSYDNLVGKMGSIVEETKLHIYTPRSYMSSWKFPQSVIVKSLQMSEEARGVTLLNRVNKVGVRTLIPILDGDIMSQFELLNMYHDLGKLNKGGIELTKPILLNDPNHPTRIKQILSDIQESSLLAQDSDNSLRNSTTLKSKPGVLILATKGSHLAMKIATENIHLWSWFSPNMLEIEEATISQKVRDQERNEDNRTHDSQAVLDDNGGQLNHSSQGTTANNSFFGLYTVNFVGSKGWDNPLRRRMLRELTTFTGATPRILTAILTYDATWLARDHFRNELRLPMSGLSGMIDFNKQGFRTSGTYFGISSVPPTESTIVTLLQPSAWILDDIITVKDNQIRSPQISDYDVATSSILTKEELAEVANITRDEVGCENHLMNVVTYDPFNQMPYHYFFDEKTLPGTIVVPNHQGYGITFICTHLNDGVTAAPENKPESVEERPVSTLQLACTPGQRMSHPINCFRSHVNQRQKRAARSQNNVVPNVQYQYSFSGNDAWPTQNSKTASSKVDSMNQYYYQPIGHRDYQVESATYGYPRLDSTLAAAAEEPPSTPAPAPAPAPPGSKLPELRQILKAAKPFVGSCVGSTTGCAMCVLVLGRLPLGTLPAACTGPCFVGTFGSCGGLLGRVFSETTVICTELFKQGLLDADTFVADAEFGKYLAETSPYTMQE